MDESKEYIDMCNKAIELQYLWNKQIGDYTVNKINTFNPTIIMHKEIRNKEVGLEFFAGTYSHNNIVGSSNIWLPRQDQLQDMVNFLSWGGV